MPNKSDLKAAVCAAIDASQDEIFAFAEDIYQHPELGFKEQRTAGQVGAMFQKMGVLYRSGLALTGVKGELAGGSRGPTVALLGEMDSVLVPDHPQADPATGAAHACGHHVQLGAMVGAGMGLIRAGVLPQLAGRVVLFAVPAEEYVEVEYRLGLVAQGKLEFLSGKSELIKLGEFDDIDMAMMVHSAADPADGLARVHDSSNGIVAKQIQFLGRCAHAGAAPWDGINALNAAHVALAAIHAQRETFHDEDTVRIHPIITKGGTLVNIIPDDVRVETYVRGKSAAAIRDGAVKVDRALRAGAVAVGGQVNITTTPGYFPLRNDRTLAGLFKQNMLSMIPAAGYVEGGHFGASTDMGDVCHIMPGLQPMIGGGQGHLHGPDYAVADQVNSYLHSAKALAMTTIDLLADDAAEASQLLAGFKPAMSRAQYLEVMRSLSTVEHFDGAAVGRRE